MARRSGHFRFESGHHGDRWLEPDLLLQRPTALRPFAIALAQRLQRGERFEVVCGPLTGGAFLAQVVAEQGDVAFAFAERFAPPPPWARPAPPRGAAAFCHRTRAASAAGRPLRGSLWPADRRRLPGADGGAAV